ncbi:hypothetical protein AOLI_G00164770 [Acnodon oligacanthus]
MIVRIKRLDDDPPGGQIGPDLATSELRRSGQPALGEARSRQTPKRGESGSMRLRAQRGDWTKPRHFTRSRSLAETRGTGRQWPLTPTIRDIVKERIHL